MIAMALPTPYTLSVQRWIPGGVPNPHGYSEGSYSAPEDLPAHAVAPGASLESISAGRSSNQVAWTVYAPAGTSVLSKDLVTFKGVEYEVDGDALDFTFSPWSNPVAGVTFELVLKTG